MYDFKENLRFAWDEFKYYSSTSMMFMFIFVCLIMGSLAFSGYEGYHYFAESQIAKQKSTKLKNYQNYNKQFSILGEQVNKNANGTVNVVYDVYNMKPYTSPSMVSTRINDLITKAKLKYNDGSKKKLAAMAVRVYNRKILFNYGLTPNALYEYALSVDNKRFSNNTSSADDNYTRVWQATNTQSASDIDYDDYNLTRQGNLDTNSKDPLSDQEFAFWLKIKMYETYLDATSVDSSVKAYLNFDLGVTSDYSSVVQTIKEFKAFDQRVSDTEGQTNFFPNKVLLKRAMVQYRPQLVYFLETGNVENSYTKAQKDLIKLSSSKYKSIIESHLKQAGEKHNGNVLFDDPFKPYITATNVKEASKLPFEPVLSENNKWFALYPTATLSTDQGGTASTNQTSDLKNQGN